MYLKYILEAQSEIGPASKTTLRQRKDDSPVPSILMATVKGCPVCGLAPAGVAIWFALVCP